MSKFKIGDMVEVINYGAIVWVTKSMWAMMYRNGWCSTEKPRNIIAEDELTYHYDLSPEIVGKIGVIDGGSTSGYSINGIAGKHAWYSQDQLKIAEKCQPVQNEESK